MTDTTKKCGSCRQPQALDAFPPRVDTPDGLTPTCCTCTARHEALHEYGTNYGARFSDWIERAKGRGNWSPFQ